MQSFNTIWVWQDFLSYGFFKTYFFKFYTDKSIDFIDQDGIKIFKPLELTKEIFNPAGKSYL